MNKIIYLESQEKIINKIINQAKQKSFILLYGKSGSGKSVLLELLERRGIGIKMNSCLNTKEKFEAMMQNFLDQKFEKLILIDEIGLYHQELLEFLRFYSDKLNFLITAHKKLDIFKQEHFKSRFNMEIKLEKMDFKEMSLYIQDKYQVEFFYQELRFIYKIFRFNMRNIDKIMMSFKELKRFYKQRKKHLYILKLCALENGLL